MFDNFVTKRLYGSGEADVAFFDLAVDRFLKNAGILSNVDVGGRLFHATGLSTQSDRRGSKSFLGGGFSVKKDIEPLLQSARVHQKLKTIVPPEPCMEGLPPVAELEGVSGASETLASDDVSLGSASTSSRSHVSDAYKSVQDKAAEILGKQKLRYIYEVFPSQFRDDLFAEPRPLPAAVITEFDRQRKDAAQFRRKKTALQPHDKRLHIQRAHSAHDPVGQIMCYYESLDLVAYFTSYPCPSGNPAFAGSCNVHCILYGVHCYDREGIARA